MEIKRFLLFVFIFWTSIFCCSIKFKAIDCSGFIIDAIIGIESSNNHYFTTSTLVILAIVCLVCQKMKEVELICI